MRKAGILSAQIGLGLLVLEILLRVYNPLPFRARGSRIVLPVHMRYRIDNEGAAKLDPVTIHTKNSLGFRGPEPPADFAGRLSLLTIGGSTTECFYLSDGRTWTDVMARELAASTPALWVNNAGLDGQSTYGHLVLLQQVVIGLHPKVAVFLVGANDIGLGQSNSYDAAMMPVGTASARLKAMLVDHVEMLAFSQNLLRLARARRAGFGHFAIDPGTREQLSMTADGVAAILRQYEPYLPAFRDRLLAIIALSRANGIEPVFVTQPALFGEAVDPFTGVSLSLIKVNGRGNGAEEWRLLEMYNDVTREAASDSHVLLIDLARELPKDSRFFYDFLHFTNEGAARVGAIVAGGLRPRIGS